MRRRADHSAPAARRGTSAGRPSRPALLRARVPAATLLAGLAGLVAALAWGQAPAGSTTFSNATSFSVPPGTCNTDGSITRGKATLYPSNIAVSGLSGTVTKVTVTLNDVNTQFGGDLEVLLVGPGGGSQNLEILSDSGTSSVTHDTVTFDDAAAAPLPQNGSWGPANSTITAKPTNYSELGSTDTFPSPAPAPSSNTTLASTFGGINPNGTWSLYVVDDVCDPDVQSIGGWSLNITTATAAATSTSVTASPNPAFTGTPGVTFTATVTSSGSPVTSGTVTFLEGSTVIGGPVAVNGSGQATLTTTTLPEGSHVITARYDGTASFGTSSGAVTEVLNNPTTVTGTTFCNTGAVTIHALSPATPYPSNIFVSGLSGLVTKVTATYKGVSHTFPGDIDSLLVGPTGQNLKLASDAGNAPTSNVTVNFDDAAASQLPQTGAWGAPNSTISAKPTDYVEPGAPDAFPAPAPTPSSATALSAFNGTDPNGTWSLYVVSDGAPDTGSIAGGWCLTFTTVAATPSTTTVVSSLNPSTTGQGVTFTATVMSGGSPVTGGTVTFKEGTTVLSGPTAVNGAGMASFTTSSLAEGNHVITAEYSGSGAVGASSGTVNQRVDNATVVTATTYCNTGSITGGNPGAATPYPSNIFVTGFPATTANVTVTLKGVTHAFPADFDVLLVAPTGQNLELVSDAGTAPTTNVTATFDDASASTLSATGAWGAPNSSVTSKPVNYGGTDAFPAPAPAPSSATTLATFNGIVPTGTWSLYVVDDSVGDVGSISGGWCLNLTPLKASPTLTTTASATVAVGGQVHDTAVVASGASPTGTVTFKLYGPNDSTCAGTPASVTTTVSGNGSYDSPSVTPAAVGTYRWTADYPGDLFNNAASSGCNAANESVVVTQAAPTISTTASAGVTLGGQVHDTAVIAGGFNPTGTITFTLYGPSDATCSTSPVSTTTATVSGNGSYDSPNATPAALGSYRWVASYGGDTNNAAVASPCNAPNESVVVGKATPTLTTTASAGVPAGGQVHDTAVLSGGFNPTGTITFTLYGPNDATCASTAASTTTATVAGNGSYDSPAFTAAAAGTYRWVASYGGDANNNAVTSPCNASNESVVVAAATPTLATTASLGVTVGGQVHDTAVLSGGFNPTGTITFTLYGPNDTTCASTAASTTTATVAGNGSYDSPAFTAAAAGTYRWVASYGGDANNAAVSGVCNAPNESVVVSQAGPTLSTVASGAVTPGGQVHDTATLAGGFNPTGTVTFTLYGPGDTTCAGTAVFSQSVPVAGNGSYDSPAFTAVAPGTYQWTASYSGDADNAAASSPCGAANESVLVGKASPTLTTTASGSVPAGGQISDTAIVGGGFNPTGTVTFALYGPNDATCASVPVAPPAVAVNANGSYPSGPAVAPAAGTYRWTAAYSGDANNNAATSACNAANESVTVTKAAPSLTTAASATVGVGGQVHDTATLAGGASPTGTVTFALFGPNDASCTTAAAFTTSAPVAGNGSYDSPAFTTTAAGTYRWTAAYSGDANNNAATSACNAANESVTVTKAAPSITTAASATVGVGGQVHDTATLAGAFGPTGTITFNLYGPNDATCAAAPAFTTTGTVNGNGAYDSAPFTTTVAGTYQWTAAYSGDANNSAATSACNAPNESVVVKATPTLTTSASGTVAAGGQVHDTATLAGGFSPTGTVTFRLYGPNDATCSSAAAFTSAVAVSGNGSYPSANFTTTRPGTYRWTASYSGDTNNTAAASACNAANESVTVTKAPTTTTVAVTVNPSNFGQAVTFTATVAPLPPATGTPTGTVTFTVDGTPVGGPVALVGGKASFTTAALSPGGHTIVASYSGNAVLLPSSGSFTQTVTCAHAVTGSSGSLVLGAGSWCLDSATVTGTLTVQPGAAVSIRNSTVTGGITSTGASAFQLCNSRVLGGTLNVSGSSGFVLIGDPGDDHCPGNSVQVPTVLDHNTGGVEVIDNSLASLTVTNTSGAGPFPDDTAAEISRNQVLGTLACSGNTPAPTHDGQPNSVSGARSGQCGSPGF
ncbi:MAG: Ig-like domain repeat protein [Acidimicrobiales bacterium]